MLFFTGHSLVVKRGGEVVFGDQCSVIGISSLK